MEEKQRFSQLAGHPTPVKSTETHCYLSNNTSFIFSTSLVINIIILMVSTITVMQSNPNGLKQNILNLCFENG